MGKAATPYTLLVLLVLLVLPTVATICLSTDCTISTSSIFLKTVLSLVLPVPLLVLPDALAVSRFETAE